MKTTLDILPFAIFLIGAVGLFMRLLFNHINFWSYFSKARTLIKSNGISNVVVNADYGSDPLRLKLLVTVNNIVNERNDIFDDVFRAKYNRRYEIWIKSFSTTAAVRA